MRELVHADSATLLVIKVSTGGDAPQQSMPNRLTAATVWYTAAAENVGPEARRVGMLGGRTRVTKSVDDGVVEACWECCTAPNTSEERRQEPG